jgi:hypothetical protein
MGIERKISNSRPTALSGRFTAARFVAPLRRIGALCTRAGGRRRVDAFIPASPVDPTIVAAFKGGVVRYWLVTTPREKALRAVRQLLPRGWYAGLTDRILPPERLAQLKMRPDHAYLLTYPPDWRFDEYQSASAASRKFRHI